MSLCLLHCNPVQYSTRSSRRLTFFSDSVKTDVPVILSQCLSIIFARDLVTSKEFVPWQVTLLRFQVPSFPSRQQMSHVGNQMEMRNAYKILIGTLKRRDYFGDISTHVKIILKWIWKKQTVGILTKWKKIIHRSFINTAMNHQSLFRFHERWGILRWPSSGM